MKKQIQTSFTLCVYLLLAGLIQTPARGQDVPVIEIPLPEPVVTMDAPGPGQVADLPPVEAAPAAPVAEVEYVDYAVTPTETVLEPETRMEDGEQKITITLDGVSLEDTLRMFAQTARANIIAAPNLLTGLFVSVSLNDVDWIPALRSILEIHNFTLAERTPGSGVFTVQRRGADAPEPTSIKTFFLDYTTATEVHEPIQRMLTPGKSDLAALQFNSRNALVVRSTESNLGELQNLIGELDRPGKQILIETRIMELNDQASKQIGIRWDSLESFGIRAGLGPFSRVEETTRDLTRESRFDREDSRSRTRSENSSRTSGDNRFFGIDGSPIVLTETEVIPSGAEGVPDTVVTRQIPTSQETVNFSSSSAISSIDFTGSEDSVVDGFARQIVESQSAILSMDSFQVVLSALERTDGVSVVSNPKMIVTSGSTNAFFKVGEREPIIRQQLIRGTTESPGDTVLAELDTSIATDFIRGGYLETGIDLGVVATAKTDDFIEAHIRPVLRRLIGQKEVSGNFWPIISVKEIGTSFTLRSGQTVAIGGLTDTQETKEISRIPVLGSIPVLGRFFSHTKDVKRQIETIIFVTLSIADPDGLENQAGIPQDARLVHNRLLREQAQGLLATEDESEKNKVGENKSRRIRGPRR
jgi:type II secretory pathway component GspD/PulD (secretin)